MDTSAWIQYNPKITVDHTLKKYYGKYLYKLVVYAPAGRLINSKPKESVEQALARRREIFSNISHGSWWGIRQNQDLANANVELLEILRGIRLQRLPSVKLRVEEPRVQIYAETQQQLLDLVNTHFGSQFYSHIESVAGPADSRAEAILNSGAIIRKTEAGYRYKVILRDGRYGADAKQNILQYLLNLGEDQAHLPKSAHDMLSKSTSYAWNLYFFANDPQVTSFLSLIQPGLVSNIHELVVLANK
jgi:hypothetical protein